MKIGDFNKMQRHNYLLATIGAIACVIGLTNASYNKGVVKGATIIGEEVKETNEEIFNEIFKE